VEYWEIIISFWNYNRKFWNYIASFEFTCSVNICKEYVLYLILTWYQLNQLCTCSNFEFNLIKSTCFKIYDIHLFISLALIKINIMTFVNFFPTVICGLKQVEINEESDRVPILNNQNVTI